MQSPNINSSLSWLALFILLISSIPNFVLRTKADPQIIEAGHGCSLVNSTNFSAFTENRRKAFSLLAPNMSLTGFATASSGNGTDKVYGLAQCRNDLSMADCRQCYSEATAQIVKYCPSENGARMIYEGCFLRYENQTFFDQAVDAGNSDVCLSDASSNPKLFNETAQRLLADVRSKALKNKGFATEEFSANGLQTAIYGLALCRRTLTTNSCDVCLQHATLLAEMCFPRQDGRGLDAGCYLRYSTFPFFPISSSPSSPSKTAIILVGTLGVAGLIAVFLLLFIFRHSLRMLYRKLSSRGQHEEAEVYFAAEEDNKWGHLYKYDSLRAATKNFDASMKIGEGGFGQVYKGIFSDGREIAVKKLFEVQQSTRSSNEFVIEVKLISAVHHRSLVRLLGCCTRGLEKLLVYEFMPNLSLDKHLFAAKPLSWKKRFEIILGTANGLAYLNEECRLKILHRDIKAANMLLDNDFQAKIADFGLAKLFPEDQSHLTTRVGGTIGYTAPEYAVHGQLTDKADVYSYGMLVLEIVSGRKYIDSTLPPDMELLLGWAWSLYGKNEAFSVVDRRLIEQEPGLNKGEILKVIQIAFLCTQGAPELRPLMSKVVSMLTSNTDILDLPTRPAFIEDNSTANGLGSVNVGRMKGSSVASSQATVSVSLEPR